MVKIETYVFLDLETTGLPKEEINKTKITEFSLVAVKRDHVLETRPGASPRVQHKLTLCLNPGRMIQPSCTDVTGLCNDLLEHEPRFDARVIRMINDFLNLLSKPVCLISQNGLAFDFPIFKAHFVRFKESLPEDLYCADCYHGFYDILEARKKVQTVSDRISVEKLEVTEPHDTKIDLQDSSFQQDMKLKNETTPKQQIIKSLRNGPNRVCKARRKMPWAGNAKPTEKYKLKDIYERVLNRPGIDAHRAENDCIMALECSVALSKEFVTWVDDNITLFEEIKPMRPGVPLGD